MAGIKEVKGTGHAAAEAVVMKDKRKQTGDGDGTRMEAGEVGQGVDRWSEGQGPSA